ncbi:hypothetical protein [Paraprevotella xylaniphila]|uniref:hypothetical protein n=1 Tax=Paraprevotella xylaniphila TaxID=454155 RepID=UPI003AB550F6
MMKALKVVICVISFVTALVFAGTSDMTEQVIYTMPTETYHDIKETLTVNGDSPSDYEIAIFYLKNKSL